MIQKQKSQASSCGGPTSDRKTNPLWSSLIKKTPWFVHLYHPPKVCYQPTGADRNTAFGAQMAEIPMSMDVLWQGDKWLHMMEQTGLWTLQTSRQREKKINFRYGIELMWYIDWAKRQHESFLRMGCTTTVSHWITKTWLKNRVEEAGAARKAPKRLSSELCVLKLLIRDNKSRARVMPSPPPGVIHITSAETTARSRSSCGSHPLGSLWDPLQQDGWRALSFKLGALSPDIIGSGLNKEVVAPRLFFPNRRCSLADSGT